MELLDQVIAEEDHGPEEQERPYADEHREVRDDASHKAIGSSEGGRVPTVEFVGTDDHEAHHPDRDEGEENPGRLCLDRSEGHG